MSANPSPAVEEVIENFTELIQRLLEIQSGGRQRSPELIEEDERLMGRLQKRTLAGPPQTAMLGAVLEVKKEIRVTTALEEPA